MPKSLLDFMAPPSALPEAFRPQKSLSLSELLDPREGERILVLGYGDLQVLEAWQKRGTELLLCVQSEAEAVKARKAGVRAVLAQAEYLSDRQRFDGIILLDPGYRMHQPERAIRHLVRALKRGGRLLMELPLNGHLEAAGEVLDRVLGDRGCREEVERIEYPPANVWRNALQRAGVSLEEDRIIYRHRRISRERLEEWGEGLIRPSALLLDPAEGKKMIDQLRQAMEACCENGFFLDEEVLLRVVGAAHQEG
ncbi:class I SAM-dependent methyltransferase [Nitratifractor salsuginis]|uniref:Methyltransferase type 11 domain-containing protein n=1 Tax=Nitratifractor salsuginis (strain DSM 16511 / JCM 12458 / E9I37-1) TaxID=749222 RepID=E6X0L7_NITSE|nr:methyltransferase domain-containing protein [Nitratifractor salsuginis]ADV45737.1 hypothetical protein Nitsa_0467 [Nitratifractor salsuginis DSM 16511]